MRQKVKANATANWLPGYQQVGDEQAAINHR